MKLPEILTRYRHLKTKRREPVPPAPPPPPTSYAYVYVNPYDFFTKNKRAKAVVNILYKKISSFILSETVSQDQFLCSKL